MTAAPGPPPIRDAEISAEYLCHKFEELSGELRREELAREGAERCAARLAAEVESAGARASQQLIHIKNKYKQ